MLAELSYLVLPPELEGRVNTVEDMMKPEAEFIPGPTLATLEEKENHYEFKCDDEDILKVILPIWEEGQKISWWKRRANGLWDSDNLLWVRPHEPDFFQVLKDSLEVNHKISCELVENSEFVFQGDKVWRLVQKPEAIKKWNRERMKYLGRNPVELRSDLAIKEIASLRRESKEL